MTRSGPRFPQRTSYMLSRNDACKPQVYVKLCIIVVVKNSVQKGANKGIHNDLQITLCGGSSQWGMAPTLILINSDQRKFTPCKEARFQDSRLGQRPRRKTGRRIRACLIFLLVGISKFSYRNKTIDMILDYPSKYNHIYIHQNIRD